MKFYRFPATPRPNWQQKVHDTGMWYHTIDGQVYWNESARYQLDTELVDKIEAATNELHSMCMQFVADEIAQGDYIGYGFNDSVKELIEKSWINNHPHIYGRFDLGIDAASNIKMFEYNADTPTSLLEASVIQWNWKEEYAPTYDQFNSIHEKLIAEWQNAGIADPIYFAAMTDAPHEDWGNLHYLLETASLAGLQTASVNLEAVGWSGTNFVDVNDNPIYHLFKLYPWEWIVNDPFFNNVKASATTFYEPIWKMLLSNKLLCVKLWEKHPNHPYLLAAYDKTTTLYLPDKPFIQKPKLGREGQGVVPYDRTGLFTTGHKYGDIIQEKFDVVDFNGIQPVIGSWVIGNQSAGIGIREDKGITTNNSQFVPHYFI